MATLDAVATLVKPGGGSSGGTFSLTVASGATLLVVTVHGTTAVTISGITYAGQALTRLDGQRLISSDALGVDIWYLASPPAGTANVVITSSGAYRGGAVARSYLGTATATPFGTVVKSVSGTNVATASVTAASATGDLVIDAIATDVGDSITNFLPGAGQTEDANFLGSTGGSVGASRIGASSKAGAASVVLSWSWTFNARYAMLAVPLKPAAGGGSNAAAAYSYTKRRAR